MAPVPYGPDGPQKRKGDGDEMRRLARFAVLVVTLAALVALSASPVAADVGGTTEGCTPGFWKTHTEAWQEYSPDQTIGSVFAGAPEPYASMTLLEGLRLKGGSGLDGAREILLRAAIASLLNAAYDSPDGEHLQFPWRRDTTGANGEPPLIPTVDAALAGDSRGTMLDLAAWLDAANNLGCPL